MDYLVIISDCFYLSKSVFACNISNDTIQNLTQLYQFHEIGKHYLIINKGLFPPYDTFLFNPYFQLVVTILGAWFLDDLFDELLWPYIRPYRNKLREWIRKCLTRRNMKN